MASASQGAPSRASAAVADLDVLIVGAGLSGIDAAYRLQTECPGQSFEIFEARDRAGGTWDLFRYPGIRSDSDMATLGFPFRPWQREEAIAEGGDILRYIEETASALNLDERIRFGHRVTSARWSNEQQIWTVGYEAGGASHVVTCSFLYLCTGYYDYAEGHAPSWPDQTRFAGRVVHPQFWPEDLDIAGKKIVVIGSGATAVTLIPALVKRGAGHVTMLQRSPTFIVSRPARSDLDRKLRSALPRDLADKAIRWKNVLLGMAIFSVSRRFPDAMRRRIAKAQRRALGPDFDLAHLTPKYDPWDQRICLVPDGDLFTALSNGAAAIVTDQIARFDEGGVELASGGRLDADIVVTATGLKVKMMGGVRLIVDGQVVDPGSRLVYRGALLEGVPNLAFAIGYTNASWTLRCDLTARFVCQILNYMDAHDLVSVRACARSEDGSDESLLGLQSGYVARADGLLPRQGKRPPWRVYQNYLVDRLSLRRADLSDDALWFEKAEPIAVKTRLDESGR